MACVGLDSKLPGFASRMTRIMMSKDARLTIVIGMKRRISIGVLPSTLYLNVLVTLRLHGGGRLPYVEFRKRVKVT